MNKMGGDGGSVKTFYQIFLFHTAEKFRSEPYSLLLFSGKKTIEPKRFMSCFSVEVL